MRKTGLGFQVTQKLFGLGHGFPDLGQEQTAPGLSVRAVGFQDHTIHIGLQCVDGLGLGSKGDGASIGKYRDRQVEGADLSRRKLREARVAECGLVGVGGHILDQRAVGQDAADTAAQDCRSG